MSSSTHTVSSTRAQAGHTLRPPCHRSAHHPNRFVREAAHLAIGALASAMAAHALALARPLPAPAPSTAGISAAEPAPVTAAPAPPPPPQPQAPGQGADAADAAGGQGPGEEVVTLPDLARAAAPLLADGLSDNWSQVGVGTWEGRGRVPLRACKPAERRRGAGWLCRRAGQRNGGEKPGASAGLQASGSSTPPCGPVVLACVQVRFAACTGARELLLALQPPPPPLPGPPGSAAPGPTVAQSAVADGGVGARVKEELLPVLLPPLCLNRQASASCGLCGFSSRCLGAGSVACCSHTHMHGAGTTWRTACAARRRTRGATSWARAGGRPWRAASTRCAYLSPGPAAAGVRGTRLSAPPGCCGALGWLHLLGRLGGAKAHLAVVPDASQRASKMPACMERGTSLKRVRVCVRACVCSRCRRCAGTT